MKKEREKMMETLGQPIYITPETREAIREIAGRRRNKRVAELEKELEELLDQAIKFALTKKCVNTEHIIISTPERRIGKTRALIKTAAEWDIPIIAPRGEAECIRKTIKEEYGDSEDVAVYTISDLERVLSGRKFSVALKSETAKLEEIERSLKNEHILLVGFDEV